MNKRVFTILLLSVVLLSTSKTSFAMKGHNPGRPGHSLDQTSTVISAFSAALRAVYFNLNDLFESNNPFYYDSNPNDFTFISETGTSFVVPINQLQTLGQLAPTIGHLLSDLEDTPTSTISLNHVSNQTLYLLTQMAAGNYNLQQFIRELSNDNLEKLRNDANYLESQALKDLISKALEPFASVYIHSIINPPKRGWKVFGTPEKNVHGVVCGIFGEHYSGISWLSKQLIGVKENSRKYDNSINMWIETPQSKEDTSDPLIIVDLPGYNRPAYNFEAQKITENFQHDLLSGDVDQFIIVSSNFLRSTVCTVEHLITALAPTDRKINYSHPIIVVHNLIHIEEPNKLRLYISEIKSVYGDEILSNDPNDFISFRTENTLHVIFCSHEEHNSKAIEFLKTHLKKYVAHDLSLLNLIKKTALTYYSNIHTLEIHTRGSSRYLLPLSKTSEPLKINDDKSIAKSEL